MHFFLFNCERLSVLSMVVLSKFEGIYLWAEWIIFFVNENKEELNLKMHGTKASGSKKEGPGAKEPQSAGLRESLGFGSARKLQSSGHPLLSL